MGKSLNQILEERGIPKAETAQKIRLRGLEPVAAELGVTLEAFRNYAEKHLDIHDAPLFAEDYLKTIPVITREILLGMYSIWKGIEADNQQLKEEIARRDREEAHREALAKARLIEMLEAVRNEDVFEYCRETEDINGS